MLTISKFMFFGLSSSWYEIENFTELTYRFDMENDFKVYAKETSEKRRKF